jgi:hypothetical protein
MSDIITQEELEFYKVQNKILNKKVGELISENLNLQVAIELNQNKYVEMAEKYSVLMAQHQDPHPDDFGAVSGP